jgi:DNA-directed RNA polymerase subunit F
MKFVINSSSGAKHRQISSFWLHPNISTKTVDNLVDNIAQRMRDKVIFAIVDVCPKFRQIS